MTSSIGMNKYQEMALNKHLSVGGLKNNGTLINAALHNGFVTNFQGKYMTYLDTEVTIARTGVDADYNPYIVREVGQLMTIRGSNATVVAGAGFPNAAAAGDFGKLRLTNNDTGTGVNGAAAMAMAQESILWIPPSTNFTMIWDIAQWSQRGLAVTAAFAEFGVTSTCSTTHIIDATKVPAYVDGTNDLAFATIKLIGNQGYLVVRPATTAALLTSAAFEIPAGAFTVRMEVNSAADHGSAGIAVYVNDRLATSLATAVAGPFQMFARACHGAAYIAATMVPPILDIDGLAVSFNV